MGRPLNKRIFGLDADQFIQPLVRVGTGPESMGLIIRQRGTNSFEVVDMVTFQSGECYLVDKDEGSLGPNEMVVLATDNEGAKHPVIKLTANKTTLASGEVKQWSFDAPDAEKKVQFKSIRGLATFTAAPTVDDDHIETGGSQFTISVATNASYQPCPYTWQVSTDNVTWEDVRDGSGTVVAGPSTATLTLSPLIELDGNYYRAVFTDLVGTTSRSESIQININEPV